MNIQTKQIMKLTTYHFEKNTAGNRRLAKVAVQCFADTFVVNQNWFSASTFVVKIATFAKHQTVIGHFKRRQREKENRNRRKRICD
jgi:hypothetical protein